MAGESDDSWRSLRPQASGNEPLLCGATNSRRVERRSIGTPQKCGFLDAGLFAAAVEHAKNDSNHWRTQNRDCHPPKVPPSNGYPGPGLAIFLKVNESRQPPRDFLKKSSIGVKNRTVTAPPRTLCAAWRFFVREGRCNCHSQVATCGAGKRTTWNNG